MNYKDRAWLIGFINTDTLVLEKAMICGAPSVAQFSVAHCQTVFMTGYGYSFEEALKEIENRLSGTEWSWILPVLR